MVSGAHVKEAKPGLCLPPVFQSIWLIPGTGTALNHHSPITESLERGVEFLQR